MGAEQGQQKRDFFLRTDLDHDCLLFAPLVGAGREGVQDDLVSGLFQACFVRILRLPGWPQPLLSRRALLSARDIALSRIAKRSASICSAYSRSRRILSSRSLRFSSMTRSARECSESDIGEICQTMETSAFTCVK
ncbi:hypothetical protein FOM02_15945 [Bradyrhizobium sp. SEMIA]|nr:hypothetical protein FOM02_15945 [Bradyrhizobium sp. SEMIA]